jgi:hypothetical protein
LSRSIKALSRWGATAAEQLERTLPADHGARVAHSLLHTQAEQNLFNFLAAATLSLTSRCAGEKTILAQDHESLERTAHNPSMTMHSCCCTKYLGRHWSPARKIIRHGT